MLSRYLILLGPEDRWLEKTADRVGDALDFKAQFRASGVSLLLPQAETACLLPQKRGCLVGTVFATHGPPRSISPDDQKDLDRICAGGAMELLCRYWGSYIACFTEGGGVTLLRDPSAGLPCYYIAYEQGYAVTSDVKLLVKSGLLKPAVAWDQITRYLIAKDLPSEQTAISGVRELLAGTTLSYRHGQLASKEAWSPWSHVKPIEASHADLVDRLYRTVRNCVACWSSELTRPLLMLSGGLDSSVMASALPTSARPARSMTMWTKDAKGDERGYSRAMASAIASNLIEDEYSLADVDLSRSVVAHLPKPCGTAHELALHAAVIRRCGETGANAVFTGNGGDNVFYNTSSIRPFFDRLFAERAPRAATYTLRDIARLNDVTIGSAALRALSFIPHARNPYRWIRETSLLTADALDAASNLRLDHRWLAAPARALPGKRGHVALLLRMQSHIEGYLRPYDMPVINPLTSQPILELALSLPTWWQVEGGRDRAVVRRAFHHDLPGLVSSRRQKGSPSALAMRVITSNISEVATRLVDGELAKRGFVDREAILAVLAKDTGTGFGYMRLLSLLDAEAWINQWQNLACTEN